MRLAAARLWNQRRRSFHQLGPLWTALHTAFPQDSLTRVPSSRWRDALSPWSVHRRFYRRVIESRDGLVRLSPYLDLPDNHTDEPIADRLVTVLRGLDAATLVPRQPVPVAVPAERGLDADAAELARLSRELARLSREVARLSSRP